jgi:hypothetical protein
MLDELCALGRRPQDRHRRRRRQEHRCAGAVPAATAADMADWWPTPGLRAIAERLSAVTGCR